METKGKNNDGISSNFFIVTISSPNWCSLLNFQSISARKSSIFPTTLVSLWTIDVVVGLKYSSTINKVGSLRLYVGMKRMARGTDQECGEVFLVLNKGSYCLSVKRCYFVNELSRRLVACSTYTWRTRLILMESLTFAFAFEAIVTGRKFYKFKLTSGTCEQWTLH